MGKTVNRKGLKRTLISTAAFQVVQQKSGFGDSKAAQRRRDQDRGN
jgi:hypothetical protein